MSDEAAARVGDIHVCPATGSSGAHSGGPVLPPGALTVKVGDAPAARLAEGMTCQAGAAPNDIVFGGAATVLAQDLPLVRVDLDATAHGGKVAPPGCPTVRIGGPAFSCPPNVQIKGDPEFQNKVIRDVYLLWTTPSGKEIFARLADAHRSIDLVPGAMNEHFHVPGVSHSTIELNPDAVGGRWVEPGPHLSPSVPAVSLGHELIHAIHVADGTWTPDDVLDPNPPPSQPKIAREEAATIGVGSYKNGYPTENSIRRDLGLPERANHFGGDLPPPVPPPARPGGP